MPDPYDDDPSNLWSIPGEKPDPARDNDDEAEHEELRGNRRPPPYIWIAVVIAMAALTVLTVALVFAPR